MTFISPATVVPRLMEQIRSDIDPSVVDALTETDLEIWATPEGTAYVDGKPTVPGLLRPLSTAFP